jgi:hypothetical protein
MNTELTKSAYNFVSQFFKRHKGQVSSDWHINRNDFYYQNFLDRKSNTLLFQDVAMLRSDKLIQNGDTDLASDIFSFNSITDELVKCYCDTPIIQLHHKEAWIHTWCVGEYLVNYIWDTRQIVNIETVHNQPTLRTNDYHFIVNDDNHALVNIDKFPSLLNWLKSSTIDEIVSQINFTSQKA